nr:src substrate cortactin-like isoform X6 [Equus asinus]
MNEVPLTDYSSSLGGKYGVQADRVDKSAVGFDYQGKTEKHESQKDYSKGFGGKYGIDKDKVDKSAVGFEYQGKTEKHESQTDYVKGFGGKFGVLTDRQDKCALGRDHQEKLQLHESQKGYKTGFGGRFGVQSERQDSCAVGFDYKERLAKHESQQDYSKGFGGKYGVQKDRMDKPPPPSASSASWDVGYSPRAYADRSSSPESTVDFSVHSWCWTFCGFAHNASTFEDVAKVASTYQKTVPVEAVNSKTSNIRANFENLAKEKEQEDRRKAEAERAQSVAKERQEQEEPRRQLDPACPPLSSSPDGLLASLFPPVTLWDAPFPDRKCRRGGRELNKPCCLTTCGEVGIRVSFTVTIYYSLIAGKLLDMSPSSF